MLLREQKIQKNFHKDGKFVDEQTTAKGEDRAYVDLVKLETLWINTGTRCNLACENCYIESSPTNDELSFITFDEVKNYLDEIEKLNLGTTNISFTGGEPFLNKEIIPTLTLCLDRGFNVLVLTNAYRAIDKHFRVLDELNRIHPGKLRLRISLDHYTQDTHEKERGPKTFERTLNTMKTLFDLDFNLSIAGRSLIDESPNEALEGYQHLINNYQLELNLSNGDNIVIFPEMSPEKNVPEITTACWDILNVHPHQQMCAHERMIVKRKGDKHPVVLPCTLIAYDENFILGQTLEESFQRVYLNHPYCAQFCVLGGGSCSA
ncbi:MAG: radical SAM protein [Balneolaceae bacterium]|nr:radical SAM protein [Balneolaceae bacterium]MBO6546722.1 radical SAM protein [Balneolaceae bacterium]MBO6649080.1 radical SAM protein [Balneolaceae bacterium]